MKNLWLIVLAMLIALSCAQAQDCSWTGTWSTKWGEMVLQQSDNQVTGNYSSDSGLIEGTVFGNVLRGTWTETPSRSPPNDAGDFEFTISADCQSFDGNWRYGFEGDSWNGDWDGNRSTENTFGSSKEVLDSLKGDIYYLPEGTSSLPDFSALTPVGSIYTKVLDIPQRSFTSGFPGITDRFEWFAIRYTGTFNVDLDGDYAFRLISDDGSRLFIDGKKIIDNDGQHPTQSISGNTYLASGQHSIEVDYFQGPREEIALQLFWTPPGGTEGIASPVYVPRPPAPESTLPPVMRPTPEELAEWITLYENAPDAAGTISTTANQQDYSPGDYEGDSFSLLPYLQYDANERNQGACSDCWQWAGTAVMEIQLAYRKDIMDRLSIEYINSNIEGSGDCKSCCGGWLDYLAKFYTDSGQAIPWTNYNADWKDGNSVCPGSIVPPDSTSTSPAYSIASIRAEKVPTQGVGAATATSNIKNVLRQGKAVWFAYFLPNRNEWANFGNFWNNQQEDAVYQMDAASGTSYNYEEAGGHAVVIVGYDDTDPNNRYWIVLNSWGTANGLRPNGLFRVNMDMNYDCRYPGFDRDYALFFQTLDVTYSGQDEPNSVNLTGVWSCDDGGTYYLKQLGNVLWWDGDDPNGEWANVAYGTIDGNAATLEYADVPEGNANGYGKLVLNIISNDELEALEKPGNYGGSRWWRDSRSKPKPPKPPEPIDTDPWNDPDVRQLIDEWLLQQDKCVKNVYPGAYIDRWGRICGETETATISCVLEPDHPSDWDNYHYLWANNWCPDYYPYRVQDYVNLRQSGSGVDDLAECKGEYDSCY